MDCSPMFHFFVQLLVRHAVSHYLMLHGFSIQVVILVNLAIYLMYTHYFYKMANYDSETITAYLLLDTIMFGFTVLLQLDGKVAIFIMTVESDYRITHYWKPKYVTSPNEDPLEIV